MNATATEADKAWRLVPTSAVVQGLAPRNGSIGENGEKRNREFCSRFFHFTAERCQGIAQTAPNSATATVQNAQVVHTAQIIYDLLIVEHLVYEVKRGR